MSRPTKIIHDAATGETVVVDLTDEEIADRKLMAEEFAREEAERETAQAAKETARESALAKLAALGLTEEEASTIIK